MYVNILRGQRIAEPRMLFNILMGKVVKNVSKKIKIKKGMERT